MKNRVSDVPKIILIILGAIVGGFMWRCRGDGGFGSSWGLYSVGLVLMLLIYHFYGNRKGMKYEMIPAINIYELEEALQAQYGFDFIDNTVDHVSITTYLF